MKVRLKPLFAIIGVFVGCCSNMIFLELMIKHDPGSGQLINSSEIAFVALAGFVATQKFCTKKRNIGFKDYILLALLFLFSSVAGSYAFDFNIPMPLSMIFRAGSLIANMILGVWILHKRYEFTKYISVLLITVGIVACTIVSGNNIEQCKGTHVESEPNEAAVDEEQTSATVFMRWLIGISLLTVALFLSSGMGIFQEQLCKRYGKHPFEALYYTHLLSLPVLLFFGGSIWEHLNIALESTPIVVPLLGYAVPVVLLYILGNILTHYLCICSVFVLTTECESLTVTLVVTLRKFVSVVFSVVYFKNDFTIYHWMGTFCVFYGTILFTEVVPKIRKGLGVRSGELEERSCSFTFLSVYR